MGPLEAVDLARDLLRTAYIVTPDIVSLDARIFARIDSSPTANVGECVSTHAGARCAIKGKHSTHAGIDNQGQMRTWED